MQTRIQAPRTNFPVASPLKPSISRGPLPICCLDTYRWNWAGTCFVTLLVFSLACFCQGLSVRVEMAVGKTNNNLFLLNRCCDKCDDVQDEKCVLFQCSCKSYLRRNSQNNLLILVIRFMLVTQAHFTWTTSVL